MKLEKNKHDHKLTQWLKVGIFALLMLAPLFASLTQTLYVTLNKNAKDSYYGETINQEEVINTNVLQTNEIYTYSYINTSMRNAFTGRININSFELEYCSSQSTSDTLNNITDITQLYFWINNGQQNITFNYNVNQSYTISLFSENNTYIYITFKFIPIENFTISNENAKNNISYIKYNKYSYLDNAFYYGVDQMTKSDLFNWTENTALYTGIKAMTDNLQVETNAIAILLTYWMILTIIYIIIDIVTNMFTFLTHMIVRSE